jgi:hypothetical protein
MKEEVRLGLLFHVQRLVCRAGPRLPSRARRPVARLLRAVDAAIERAERVTKSFPWFDLQQVFVQGARHVDEQVLCPHCGRPAPVGEIERLKTYCLDCSVFGHEPPGDDAEATSAAPRAAAERMGTP